jgi:hypothetical protein
MSVWSRTQLDFSWIGLNQAWNWLIHNEHWIWFGLVQIFSSLSFGLFWACLDLVQTWFEPSLYLVWSTFDEFIWTQSGLVTLRTCQTNVTETQRTWDWVQILFQFWFKFGLGLSCTVPGSSLDLVWNWLGSSWPLLWTRHGSDSLEPLRLDLVGVSSALVRTWLGFSFRLCLDLVCIGSAFSLHSIWIWFDTRFSSDIASI